MADLKTSQFGTITAAQADSAGTEGYIPYVDPSQVDPDLRNKRMTRSEAKKFFGLQVFTALSGTSWDGSNKALTLTSNTALTFSSTKRNGVLRIKQDGTGSRTLSINGISVPVATDANTITVITFFYDDVAGAYVFSYDTNILGNVGGASDITPPTVASGNAIDSTHVTLVFSETVVPTAAGFSVHDTVTAINYSFASVTGGGNTWTFALGSGSMIAGNALTLSYDSSTGNTVDTSSNELVSFSGFSITNSIGGTDADAQAYFDARTTAGDPLTSGDETKWNAFVVGAKAAGIWTDIKAAWYINGTDGSSLGINAKTPGTFDLAWTGTGTPFLFDSTGATPNSSTAKSETGIIPSTHLASNNAYLGFFSRDTNTSGESYMIGALDTGVGGMSIQNSSALLYGSIGTHSEINNTAAKDGFMVVSRTSSTDLRLYRNATEIASTTTANAASAPTHQLYLFKLNLDGGVYAAAGVNKCGFAIVGQNLTPTKQGQLNTLVQTLMA